MSTRAKAGSQDGLVRLESRRLTCLVAIRLLTNWMTDGMPTGSDAEGGASRGEAIAIRRWLDKRLAKIRTQMKSLNTTRSATGEKGPQ